MSDTENRSNAADGGLRLTTCSQLDVMRTVFEEITKEMQAMERIEAKAAEDRHWSMADAMKNKRLAYDSALGFAMRGIERAFSSANVSAHAPLPAGASVDHGVDVETTEEHVNRAAGSGCRDAAC